jgi:hypothetical protein
MKMGTNERLHETPWVTWISMKTRKPLCTDHNCAGIPITGSRKRRRPRVYRERVERDNPVLTFGHIRADAFEMSSKSGRLQTQTPLDVAVGAKRLPEETRDHRKKYVD